MVAGSIIGNTADELRWLQRLTFDLSYIWSTRICGSVLECSSRLSVQFFLLKGPKETGQRPAGCTPDDVFIRQSVLRAIFNTKEEGLQCHISLPVSDAYACTKNDSKSKL